MSAPPSLKPFFLLADSQSLFWREGERPFLARVGQFLEGDVREARAAYLGASNGDMPEFFELFRAAFADVGIARVMHVTASPTAAQLAFLAEAQVILLAGGDVQRGYSALEAAGLVETLRARWSAGAVLMGVSAGAVQLGAPSRSGALSVSGSLSLVPYVISAHEEPEWRDLCASVEDLGPSAVGLGIPSGGAAIVHPDLSVEPMRKPIAEVTLRGTELHVRHLLSAEGPPAPLPDAQGLLN